MSSRLGKISIIPKDYTGALPTQEKSLSEQGYHRFPGTFETISIFKEIDGRYRTGLDEDAAYIRSISDPLVKEQEKERVRKLKKDLEDKLDIDLGPRADYYRFNGQGDLKVDVVKVGNTDLVFDLDEPLKAVTFAWLRVHPKIAPSIEAYNRGEVSPNTNYYVKDDEIEVHIQYSKLKALDDAILKLGSLSLEKRKKIARLVDLPIGDGTKEDVVYVALSSFLRQSEIKSGPYTGRTPINVFNTYVEMESDALDVRDIVEQAFKLNLYRPGKNGRIMEGQQEVYNSKEEMIEHLLNSKNQADRLALEKKLNIKKIAEIA